MFAPQDKPRLFALPPGVDFPRAVVDGLMARMAGQPPEAMARVTLYVNTRRMQRRIAALFDEGPALVLPRLKLITDIGRDAAMADLPPAVSPLRRRLELAELIGQLLERQPDLAPRAAIYDLADSLAALMDEMQGEGVPPDAIEALDVSDLSGHWARSLAFINLVTRFFGKGSDEPPDIEARQRMVIERICTEYGSNPPQNPIIVAGSTGSRGATGLFMEAVSRLPQGAVILPGFDDGMRADVWDGLEDALAAEDHPQYRFARLMRRLDLRHDEVPLWHDTPPPAPERNALISLALRPAPVTDQWQEEGPRFAGIGAATRDMTLIEAPSPRDEATAIALILREAAEDGRPAALITPDRMLTRQVAAALDRWRIEPDDSAGTPLTQSAPGRLLLQVANALGETLSAPALLALLKHPLTAMGGEMRGDHLRFTRDLELEELRGRMPFPTLELLLNWAGSETDKTPWATWVGTLIGSLSKSGICPLSDHVAHVVTLAEQICAGPEQMGPGALWERKAGQEARRIIDELIREAPHGGEMSPADFRTLFAAVLSRGEVRDPVQPHPGIMFWGTLEARVQGVELVVLAGLNDGTWPERPSPDPWMNRQMRHNAGLLLPERRIGLSAHDFQQAIGARRVVLTRSVRDAESETVPSRWVNRLVNLMSGMSDEGAEALKAMRARGDHWLALAEELERPVDAVAPAPRPSPQPPVELRPRKLAVTRISTLVRDPYAIYVQKILNLRPLAPLHPSPDALLRGTVLHGVMERFVRETPEGEARDVARDRLMRLGEAMLEDGVPWPAARVLWLAKLDKVADWFLEGEALRRDGRHVAALEARGELYLNEIDFTLYGTADRIDADAGDQLYIYDYKTGQPPTPKQQRLYDKQLLLEALIADQRGFKGLPEGPVKEVSYIGLGAKPTVVSMRIDDELIEATRDEFVTLIREYQDRQQGYTSRRLVETQAFPGDYDHLARLGEWDYTNEAQPEKVGD